MTTFGTVEFVPCKEWIEEKRYIKNKEWADIDFALRRNDEGLQGFLTDMIQNEDWPSVSIEEWHQSIRSMEEAERRQGGIIWPDDNDSTNPPGMLNRFKIPSNPQSSWQLYKNYLSMEKHWPQTSIDALQNSALFLLNRLGHKTEPNEPVQGLVLGYVQSGKTANMEALMAMAADQGWNFFVILGGTKDNLRIQTRDRMLSDLNRPGSLQWRGIEHPSANGDAFDRPQTLFQNPNERYFTVCLKVPQRLKSLIDWICQDANSHKKMRIIIIDDEADQASINSRASQGDITRINSLIRDLVHDDQHQNADGSYVRACAINYIMYTATPYANFLNEADEASLYPHNFIYSLEPSKEYIGPNQYFGGDNQDENDGLDIKRIISKTEINSVKQLQNSGQGQLPEELQKAIAWFYCCAAIMRKRFANSPQPISMLIHTSQRQTHHEKLAEVVKSWISKNRLNGFLLRLCRDVYADEKKRETIDMWKEQLPTYGSLDKIDDYPSFETFMNYLTDLLAGDLRYLPVDNNRKPIFEGTAPYLAIDNSDNNRIINDELHRLLYPDPHEKDRLPTIPPVYIVIGGNTLARGLTLEGLVCTYFLRTANQYDTLMQMGRWFGYRRGYELLPRLWLSADTLERFVFLAEQELLLRNELKEYAIRGVTPDQYAPSITLSGHSLSWLRPTRSGAMTNAIEAEHDFSGASPQTITFDSDSQIQINNLEATERFINKLPDPRVSHSNSSLIFEQVGINIVTQFLRGFTFCKRGIVFSDIDTFIEYLDACANTNANIRDNWHVIVVGVDDLIQGHIDDSKRWDVKGYSLKKVNRSKLRLDDREDTLFYLKAISSQSDKIADLDLANGLNHVIIMQYLNSHKPLKKKDVEEVRKMAELTDIPLLIIYRIDKDSQPLHEGSNVRAPLNSANDLIGLQICIPGCRTNFVKKLKVNLPNVDTEADGLEEEEHN